MKGLPDDLLAKLSVPIDHGEVGRLAEMAIFDHALG
jgi:hypothetical protein